MTESDPNRSSEVFTPACLSPFSHRLGDGSVVSPLHCVNDPQPEGHMASHIGRRKFLATLGGAAATWPLAARAQQGERMRRIGLLVNNPESDQEVQRRITVFRQAIAQFGWV